MRWRRIVATQRLNFKIILTTLALLILPIYLIWEDVYRAGRYDMEAKRQDKVWISISACFKSEDNSQSTAALIATRLWLLKTKYDVLLQIVPNRETNVINASAFAHQLQSLDPQRVFVRVSNIDTTLSSDSALLDCDASAELSSLLAHVVFADLITSESDRIVISDPWAFPISGSIFSVLREDFIVWLFRYKLTSVAGRLFPTTFMGMTTQMWRILLEDAKTPLDLITKHRRVLISNKELRNRPSDRLMTSLLLESRLCHLSPKNLVWKKLNSTPPLTPARDALVCFHGYEWEPCDVNGSYDGDDNDCMWWRADKAHDKEQLEKTFEEISNMPEW